MNPVFFQIGNFSIKWYSVLILIGVLFGYELAEYEGKKHDISKDFMFNMTFSAVIAGLCTEYQLTLHSTEIEIVDRTRDGLVTYILGKTADGKEKLFKIEILYRRNMSHEKLANLYLKCKPGSKHEIMYCTDDSSDNSYIIEIK